MSTSAANKRPFHQAHSDATAFWRLFPPTTFERWNVAGSLRRRRELVGDIDHCVIPAFGEVEVAGGLFAQKETKNLLWHHLDAMLNNGGPAVGDPVAKAIVGSDPTGRPKYRWGEQQRAILFRSFVHEIYSAEFDNWGGQLAVRTGPEGLSTKLVIGLKRNGYMSVGGFHVGNMSDCFCRCGWAGTYGTCTWKPLDAARADGQTIYWRETEGFPKEAAAFCPKCGEAAGLEMRRVPAPTEEEYFRLAGIPFVPPERRS